MIWRFIICLVAITTKTFAATGDILSVEIRSDGWTADITIEGLSTGGTYDLGWNADNSNPGSAKIVFSLTSPTQDESKGASTIARTVYSGARVRKPYPNEAQAEESVSGSDVIVRVSLSEYVYVSDSSITVDIGSGFYTQAATPNNAASSFGVTNSSTAAYQPSNGNWSWPGYERVTGEFKLRCVVAHRSGQLGRPCRGVKFTVTDGVSPQDVIVTSPTIDATMADGTPIQEYVATFNAADFLDDTVLTADFTAWGWVGNTGTDLTTVGGTAAPTALIGPQKLYCDNNNDQGVYAKVDPTSPSGTPATYSAGTYNFATAEAYATINAAFAAGANVVELVEDNHAWTGGNAATGATPDFWDIVRAGPGQELANVVINSASGDVDISDRVKIQGCTITTTTANSFSGTEALWFHDCALNSTSSSLMASGMNVWMTQSDLHDFQMSFTGNSSLAMVRGCELRSGFSDVIRPHTFIGNLRNAKWVENTIFNADIVPGSGQPVGSPVIAFNRFFGYVASGAATMFEMFVESPSTGMILMGNVFEKCDDNTGGEPVSNFNASEGNETNTPIDNVILWNNTFLGGRTGFGYNSSGSILKHRRQWSVKNNYFEVSACKTDTFTPGATERVGNWPLVWGVGHSGNMHGGNADVGPAGFFDLEWGGPYSQDAGTQDSTYAKFVDRKAFAGAGEADGLGDYHTLVDSPLRNRAMDVVLPFDVEGDRRSAFDSTGAFANRPANTLTVTGTLTIGP